ncbi:MAG: hypothetical protein ABIH23_09470, partial [bacterium]
TLDTTLGADSELEIYRDTACPDPGGDPEGEGYQITLTSFGQAYMDNESEGLDSKTDGQVDLPFPAGIDIPFDDMTLNPCGNFTDGKIPEDEQTETRTLQHWSADLTLSTVAFELKEGATDDEQRTLWISSVNDVSGLGSRPLMQINFRPCGTIAQSMVAEPVDTTIDGYGTTVETLYLTSWDGADETKYKGFYSFVNPMDVPFFDPPRVHSQIRPTAHYLADGSPWDSNPNVDSDRDGWPSGYSTDTSKDIVQQFYDYSNSELITLTTNIGGVIDLNYEVKYDTTETSFESNGSLEQNLLVIDIRSALEHLDQSQAEITFGIGIEGMPELNFSSASDLFGEFFSEESEIGDTIQELFFDTIQTKLDNLSNQLTGDISGVLRPLLYDIIHPHAESLVEELQDMIADLPVDEAEAIIDANASVKVADLITDLDFTDLFDTSDSDVGAIYEQITLLLDNIITILEDVSEAMQFSVDDIEGMVGDLVQLALAVIDMVTDIDVDDVLGDISEIQQELVAPINEILTVLYEAQAILDGDLSGVFDATGISEMEVSIETDFPDYFKDLPIEQIETLDADEVTNLILDVIFNSPMFQEANALVSDQLIPVKEMLYEQATAALDELNDKVDEFLDEALNFSDGDEGAFKDVAGFRGAEMEGYAIISGDVLEKLHIDASLSLAVPDEMTFAGYLDVTRYEVENSGKNCLAGLDADAMLDIRIGATDIDLSWTGSDLSADIEFALMLADAKLVNIGGSIVTEGSLDFETVTFSDLGFGLAVGQIENYIWAMGKGKFGNYTIEGGIFLGTCCSLEPLEILDPQVASLLSIDEMRGVFASVGASFPIYNYGCILRIAAEAEIAGWYFADGPTYGGKLVAGAYGEGLCVVSVKGEITLIGGREGSASYFYGEAWVAGGIGDCEPEDWDTLNDAFSDKWCMACGASIDLTYKQEEWEVDYEASCD